MSLRIKPALLMSLMAVATVATAAPPIGNNPNINPDRNLIARLDRFQLEELQRREIVSQLRFCRTRDMRLCSFPATTADADIDVHRSLFVHDAATLNAGNFSLQRTLGQLASQVVAQVPGTSATSIFSQLWDTQAVAPGVTGTGNPHCDDNGGTVNNFPNSCRPAEAMEAQGSQVQLNAKMASYAPIALVNRLDLAHEGWRNCGEYRIIYGKQGGSGRNLIIFEAVLPNPKPGCREGCLPVAEFWKSLSSMNDPAIRASALENFFYTGLPGFRPIVHVDHYSATGVSTTYGSSGSGQIRTNQFMQGPWTLKEFKTVLDCGATPCRFQLVPIMVKVNPQGELWNEDIANTAGPMQARASAFQSAVVGQIPNLANHQLMGITYSVALEHDAAQSISQGSSPDDFLSQFNAAAGVPNAFRTDVVLDSQAHLDFSGNLLTADKIIRRAVTQDCAGCHEPRNFGLTAANSIGSVSAPGGTVVTSWPDSLRFVHVGENPSALAELSGPAFPSNQGFPLSPALRDHFLVARKQLLLAELNRPRCVCRNCFRFPVRAQLDRANRLQDALDRQFAPRIDSLNKKLRAASDTEARSLSAELDQLLNERDAKLAEQLKAAMIDDVKVDLRPQAVRLTAAKLAQGDRAKERRLRQQQIVELIKKEPPRRTVTNSFRVH